MKTKSYIFIITCIVLSVNFDLIARQQKTNAVESLQDLNIPILFTAENESTGKYWPADQTALLGEEEYNKVIAINKKQLNTKTAKKLRKNKIYLGSYIDKKTKKTFYVYGITKNPAPIDDSPDADVLTQIAIEIDYGPGE